MEEVSVRHDGEGPIGRLLPSRYLRRQRLSGGLSPAGGHEARRDRIGDPSLEPLGVFWEKPRQAHGVALEKQSANQLTLVPHTVLGLMVKPAFSKARMLRVFSAWIPHSTWLMPQQSRAN